MSNYIKNLISTQGWKEVEVIFNDAITALKNADINENLPADEYKIVSLANKKAAKKFKDTIRKIKLQGRDIKQEFKSYK
jgi:hypothetical protein